MVRTIYTLTLFWIFMVFSLLLYIPFIPLSIPGLHGTRERYVLAISRMWARYVLFLGGIQLEIRGLEHIPPDKNICFVSNHQSSFDIPVVMASLPRVIGFMAKKELKYIPFLSSWMKTIGCLFLDRKNPRQAIKVFEEGARQIREGRAKLIFPEGTRSRDGRMKPIRSGALKLAFRSDATVVPLTIDGTFHRFEETGKMRAGNVRLTIHPPISVAGLNREQQKEAAAEIERQIAAPLLAENRPQ